MKGSGPVGRYSPLKQAHARIQKEIDAPKGRAAGPEVKAAAQEVTDKDMARALWATTPPLKASAASEAPATSNASAEPAQAPPPARIEQKETLRAHPPQAESQNVRTPTRPERHRPRPTWAFQGLGPGGNETHATAGPMRAVRFEGKADPGNEQPARGAHRNNRIDQSKSLRAEAEKLFKRQGAPEKDEPKTNKVQSEQKDGGEGIDP